MASVFLMLQGRHGLQERGVRCKDRRDLRLRTDVISGEMLLEREKNPEEASQKMSQQRSLSRSVQRGRRKVGGKWFLIKKQKGREDSKDQCGHPVTRHMDVEDEA